MARLQAGLVGTYLKGHNEGALKNTYTRQEQNDRTCCVPA